VCCEMLTNAHTCCLLVAPHACSMGIMPTLVMERAVYLRERSDGLYLPLVYLVGVPGREPAGRELPAVRSRAVAA
jgi:hypothetical protein